jgi:4-amino-4-deoxy-L-arabinose transferase-like glycosyltransferase
VAAGSPASVVTAARSRRWRGGSSARIIAVLLVVLALGVRVWEVERTSPYTPINDGQSYLTLGSQVANHGDYLARHTAGSGAGGSIGPTAYFPPAYPYFLAGVDLLDGHTAGGGQAVHDARLATAALGAVTVGLLGLVALEAFGPATALIAMLIAALYLPWIELAGTPYSENLLIPLELVAVWAGLRSRRARNPFPLLAAAGVFTGLATLTHQNGIVILLPLVACALGSTRTWLASPLHRRARSSALRTLAGPLVLLVCAALTIAPWTIRNAIVLHRLIPVTDENGITLAGEYNPSSAADHRIPYAWKYYIKIPADAPIARAASHLSEPTLSSRLVTAALDYIGRHPAAPAEAAYHNLRRLLDLEGSAAWRVSGASLGLTEATMRIAVYAFWVVAILACVGLFTRRARRAPPWLWAVPVLLALSVIVVNAETPRFRAPIDPYVIMLAACALLTAAGRFSRRASRWGRARSAAAAGPE